MKHPFGDKLEFFMGLEDLYKKCNKSTDCELIIIGKPYDG